MTVISLSAEEFGFSRSGRRTFRLPCGHVLGEAAVSERLRVGRRAAWLHCRTCSVVAVVVRRRPAGRRARP